MAAGRIWPFRVNSICDISKGREYMNTGGITGLVMFVIGIIVLIVWSLGMGGAFVPGIILIGGGVVLMWLFGRSGKS